MQSVRDGTYPITRLDLLWPLAGIALLIPLVAPLIHPPQKPSSPPHLPHFPQVGQPQGSPLHFPHFLFFLFSIFTAFLILPAYPFVLTAYNDAELGPQFWLGILIGIAVILLSLISFMSPISLVPFISRISFISPISHLSLISLISLISLLATLHAFLITRQPIAEMLTHPAPPGYGVVLAILGFALLTIISAVSVLKRLNQ